MITSLRAQRSNPSPQRKNGLLRRFAPRKKVAQKRCHTTNIEPQTFIQGGSVPYPPVPTRNDGGGTAVICPTGLIPGIHRRRVQEFFVRTGRARSTISRANSTNPPDGQITQKSVKPLLQKYSDFPKSQISL